MRLVKKWLFPVLTCLIVAGAAMLPPYISQVRDEHTRQLWAVHAEELSEVSLPAAQLPALLDRLALYSGRLSQNHPVLASEDVTYFEDSERRALAQAMEERLTGAGILPAWIFEEEPFEERSATRLLLWDPATGGAYQEPSAFWRLAWSHYSDKSHQKSIQVTEDAETGLPIDLRVHDTNMSQWMPYDRDRLRALAERFFDLLGLEAQEIDSSNPMGASLELQYSIAGTGMGFFVSRDPTMLTIQPDLNWRNQGGAVDSSSAFDG